MGDFCRAIYRQLTITKGYLSAIILTFAITFVFFPAVMDDTNLGFMVREISDNETSWFSLFMLLLFNVGDTAGRMIGGKPCAMLNRKAILCGSFARILFFVTFIPIIFATSGVFYSDWFIITNALVFGFSNGYFSTLCAINAPGTVPEALRQETGALVGAVISIGIVTGCFLAIPMGFVTAAADAKTGKV